MPFGCLLDNFNVGGVEVQHQQQQFYQSGDEERSGFNEAGEELFTSSGGTKNLN